MELRDSLGARVATAMADDSGAFELSGVRPGTYRLNVQRVGIQSWASDLPVRHDVNLTVSVTLAPIGLEDLLVRGERQCPGERESVERTFELLSMATEALELVALTEYEGHVFQVHIEETLPDIPDPEHYNRYRLPPPEDVLVSAPIATLPPEALATSGYVQLTAEGALHYYPLTAATFIATEFQGTHCFGISTESRAGEVGLTFEPIEERGAADVEGTLWLDAGSGAPVALEYTFTRLKPLLEQFEVPRVYEEHRRSLDRDPRMAGYVLSFGTLRLIGTYGGRLQFDRVSDGSWITRSWEIRIPLLGPGGQADWSRAVPRSVVRPVGVRIVRRGTVTGVARTP